MHNETDLARIRSMEQRYEYENRMMDAVSHGDVEKAKQIIFDFSSASFEERSADPLRNLQNYCIIMNTLCRKAAEQGGVHPLFLDQASSDFAHKIEHLRNISAIPAFMQEMMQNYCRLVQAHTVKQYSNPVKKAVLYIESNLSNELSLSAVASAISVSAGYLSTLFRKEIGQCITDYINSRRIQYACRLLRTTDHQIQIIAQRCGFLDLHYFCRQFKKATGQTPTAYRKTN